MSGAAELARLSVEDGVATLTLNRPEKRNALSRGLLIAVRECVGAFAAEPSSTVLVLDGAGKAFSAGMDLKSALNEEGAAFELLSAIAELAIELRALPAVVIAKAHGAAIGGGCGLMVAADIAATHPDSKVGFPEVDLGVCPAVVAPLLAAKIGPGRARRVLLEGGTMSGREAFERGFVDVCVPREELDGRVGEMAGRIAKAGPRAIATTKAHLGAMDGGVIERLVREGAALSAEVIAGAEARERLSAIYG